MLCDLNIRPMQKMHTYDSVSPLSSRVRFVKQNLMSSESLLRTVVNKSHFARRASHYVLYPKFLVNYPFVLLTAFLGSRIITHSRNHIYEYSHVCICKRIQEIIYVNIRMCAYVPHQWKMTPHQWKMTVTPPMEIKSLTPAVEISRVILNWIVAPLRSETNKGAYRWKINLRLNK